MFPGRHQPWSSDRNEAFHTHFEGEKVTLIWDGLPAHKSKAMLAWAALQRSWLVVERLPGYAPELNPVELVWGNVKTSELANLCSDTIDDAEVAADAALERIGNNGQLCFNFLEHTGLSL
jgi:transposase